jgi:hypothetical protein
MWKYADSEKEDEAPSFGSMRKRNRDTQRLGWMHLRQNYSSQCRWKSSGRNRSSMSSFSTLKNSSDSFGYFLSLLWMMFTWFWIFDRKSINHYFGIESVGNVSHDCFPCDLVSRRSNTIRHSITCRGDCKRGVVGNHASRIAQISTKLVDNRYLTHKRFKCEYRESLKLALFDFRN